MVDLIFLQKHDSKSHVIRKTEPTSSMSHVASVFNARSDDEDDSKVDVTKMTKSASGLRAVREAERMHIAALAEDPTLFDYDESYDKIQEAKNEKTADQKQKDRDRVAKYAPDIMTEYRRRQLEEHSRDERLQRKERIKEAGQFADKEEFITSAYRKQLEDIKKHTEEQERIDHIDEATAIDKQMIWQTGYSRTLLETIARGGDPQKDLKLREEEKPIAFKARKQGNIRRRESTPDAVDAEIASTTTVQVDNEIEKKFDDEIKPGLNRPRIPEKRDGVRALTKMERLRQALSEDEEEEPVITKALPPEEEKLPDGLPEPDPIDENAEEEPEEKPRKRRLRPTDPEVRAARLTKMKGILKQRNGPEEIEAARQRYLTRRASNEVMIPL